MNDKQTLQDKIAKMEKGLGNPAIQGTVRDNLEKSIATAKAQLAEMEKASGGGAAAATAPAPEKKEKKAATPKAKKTQPPKEKKAEPPKLTPPEPGTTKAEVYALLDAAFPGQTREKILSLPQGDYDALISKMRETVRDKDILHRSFVSDWVASYIMKHIPAGEKQKAAKPEPKPEPKTEPAAEKPVYSWKKKTDIGTLKPIVLHCQHYTLEVKEDTLVRLKGTGDGSITVTAKKGEHLIFDDDGYLVFIMIPASFKDKCNENITLDEHFAKYHQKKEEAVAPKEKKQVDLKTLERQVHQAVFDLYRVDWDMDTVSDIVKGDFKGKASKEQLNEWIEAQIVHCNTTKNPPLVSDVKTEPNKKTDPEKPAAKSTEEKPKKRSVCSLDDAETGRRVNKVVNWFLKEATDWRESKSSRQITKIMRVKGKEGQHDVIVEVADYAGMSGIAAFLGGRKYYRLCVDSFSLDKVDKPKAGSYQILIKEQEMKRIYTTKGDEMYMACLKTYKELLHCSMEGTCTEAQKGKWKSNWHECGDLIKKLEKNPDAIRKFHNEVKLRRKAGESYTAAASRVADEIKAQAA